MPNQIDLFPQNNKVTHNPNAQINIDVAKYSAVYPFSAEASQAQLNAAVTTFVTALKQLTGIDLSSIANFFLGTSIPSAAVPDLNNLINGIWAGLNGIAIALGLESTPAAVSSATAAQTQAVQAIAASVAKLSAQIASATLAHDAFDRSSGMGSDWSVEILTSPLNFVPGFPFCDGSQLVWNLSGLSVLDNVTGFYRWIGVNRLATTDYTENAIVFGTPLGDLNGLDYVDIYARVSDDMLTWVRCRIGNENGSSVMRLQYAGGDGVANEIGALAIPTPAAGSTAKFYCGTQVDLRQFQIIIDNDTYIINDPHHLSAVGGSFRGRGCGQFAGFAGIFGQYQPGSIADWQANDISPLPGVAIGVDGGGAADGDPTQSTVGDLSFGGR